MVDLRFLGASQGLDPRLRHAGINARELLFEFFLCLIDKSEGSIDEKNSKARLLKWTYIKGRVW